MFLKPGSDSSRPELMPVVFQIPDLDINFIGTHIAFSLFTIFAGDVIMDIISTDWFEQLEIALTVLIAALLGGLVGYERELMKKSAGLRTHAILAAAAALLVGVGNGLVDYFTTETQPGLLRTDPIRIVEAIVTGVAFLGAGTIFRHHSEGEGIEGLTTAASLLLVAGIGITVAIGQLLLAGLITLMSLVILHSVKRTQNNSTR